MFPSKITKLITLYKRIPAEGRSSESYECEYISGAFWDDSRSQKAAHNKDNPAATVTVYIPYREGLVIKPGDLLIVGAGRQNVSGAGEIYYTYPNTCAKVLEVKDRCFGSPDMWHWEVKAG